MSSTDYASAPENPPATTAEHLLDLDGLRRVIQMLDRLAEPGHNPSITGDRVQTKPLEPL